jgi:hypothetical protein
MQESSISPGLVVQFDILADENDQNPSATLTKIEVGLRRLSASPAAQADFVQVLSTLAGSDPAIPASVKAALTEASVGSASYTVERSTKAPSPSPTQAPTTRTPTPAPTPKEPLFSDRYEAAILATVVFLLLSFIAVQCALLYRKKRKQADCVDAVEDGCSEPKQPDVIRASELVRELEDLEHEADLGLEEYPRR